MNLNSIVGSAVAAVNPWVTAMMQPSQGYTTGGDGKRVPVYGDSVPIQVQLQSLQYRDLVQLDGLNVNGERRALYINGDWQAVVRSAQEGGDLAVLPDGTTWLVVMQLENWSMTGGWCKVAVTEQNGK
ncbi:hypothetical protein PQR71_40145 [Paraburkholderia fungorum]|uniref:hypothetical protein n=1 Tax=Paraburkholderia fungorum TaxID=134537 RepID=UPI0038BC1629